MLRGTAERLVAFSGRRNTFRGVNCERLLACCVEMPYDSIMITLSASRGPR